MRTMLRSKVTLLSITFAMLLTIPAVALAQDALDPTGAPSPAPPSPTIQSDKEDYPPADTVILTGSNWQPGETVNINVNDDEGQTWNRNVDVVADENGNIRDEFVLPDWFVATYSVTATGSSGTTATSTFTDAVLPSRGCMGPPLPPNSPALINVTTTADQFDDSVTTNTECSLREAISAANADPVIDTIILPQGDYTLTLSGAGEDNNETGDLDVLQPLRINGSGARTTNIQAGTNNTNGIDRVLHGSSDGDLVLNGATVRYGHSLNGDGGGIKSELRARLNLTDVAVTDNRAASNGGGISAEGGFSINRGTISGNTAASIGGGLYLTNVSPLTNVTISGNTASLGGGGLFMTNNNYTITNATVSHNSAPSGSNMLGQGNIGIVTLRNTIVSDGIGGANCALSFQNFESISNLESDTNTCGFGSKSGPNVKANLGDLANNGGPTDTRALGAQSAAIDAGSTALNSAPSVDQRNLPRPRDGDGDGTAQYDIGAYELQAPIPANTAPVANDDAATTNEDTSVAINVKANDTDADGNSLSVVASSLSDPASGTVALITSGADAGKVRYTPDPNYNNTGGANADTFTYKVSDSTAESNAATVRVSVNPDNDAPTISDIANQETDEDVLTSAINFTIGDVETAANSLEVEGSSSNTSLVPNNNIVFGGSGANRTVTITPAAEEFGTAEITVTVTDANGGTVSDTFTLTVDPVNDPPVANGDEYNTNEDTQLQVAAPGVLDNDSDAEGSTLSAVLGTGPSDGTLDLHADGSFTYDPDPNFNGSDSFTYRASDGSTNSDLAAVDIIVDPVNDAPTTPGTITSTQSLTNDGAFQLDWGASTDVEGDDVTYTLAKMDSDDANFSEVASGLTSPSYTFGGTSPIEDEGTWDYRVKAVDSPAGAESDYSTAENLVKVDQSKPNAPLASAGPADYTDQNGDKWYKDSATVSFAANGDPPLADGSDGSGVKSVSDPATRNTSGVLDYSGKATDNAGNESNAASGSVKVDAEAPTSSASAKDSANNDYNSGDWTNKDVTVTLSADDGQGSGVKHIAYSVNGNADTAAGSPKQITVSDEGTTTITFHAVDNVGKEEAQEHTFTVKLDKTAPTITGSRSPDANSFGWNNENVTVSFTCSDELSGLDSSGCPANVTLSSEGADQSVTRTVTDAAGNSASDTVDNINIDKTDPTISDLGPTSPPNGNNNWYITDVTNRFKASDSGSGLSDACRTNFPADQAGDNVQSKTTSGEGSAVTVTSDSCTDLAGNTATGKDSATFKIDKTAPSVSGTIPQANATRVSRTTPVTANFAQGGSGIDPNTLTSQAVQLFSGNSTKPIKATLSTTSSSVTLTPASKLDANTTYRAVVSTGVKDLAGNALDQDQNPSNSNQPKEWIFTTGAK